MFESSTLTTSLNIEALSIAAPLLPSLPTLRQSSGSLTFNNGQLTSRFNTPDGETSSTVSIAQFTSDLSTALQQLEGTLTFDRGNVTSDLTTPNGALTGTFPFAQSVSSFLDDIVRSFSGNVPFSDGRLNLDIPTPFGQIAGTIEFGNGALVSNLNTPLGSYFSSIDFREQDQIPFSFNGVPAVVNFNDGLVILDLFPQTQGDEIGIPINSLNGNIAFNNGQATLSIPTPFGSVATNFDLSALVNETVTDALDGSGTVTFTNGIAAIDVSGDLGTVRTTLNLPQLAQNVGTFLANSQGTISFDRGIVTSNLITPEGNLAGTIDLSSLIS
ncbi:hypothetical protein IQ250_06480 [Pseudanabaenaceae cyanobacterium LEGE 13415]|nr:hypothetical protein [Pseudanabaenaceae cyanobacterium LEGE 13415]